VYILLAIASVAFLIVVHEGGHYVVARWCQMRVDRFSIGFGPGILKKTSKKTGTTFQLAPIPFGGFVEIRGMNIAEEVEPDDVHAYPNRPAWQRFLTIFAGPATNYLSAIVLAMALFTCNGVPHWYGVGQPLKDYDAYGKLEAGDRIVEVDHQALFIDSTPTLAERVNAQKGAPLTLTIERAGQRREVSVTPKLTKDKAGKPIWLMGVSLEKQNAEIGILDSAKLSLIYPVEQTKAIGGMIYSIVFESEKADVGGPVRMVEEFRNAFSHSLVAGVELIMALSVYLGLFNLLPIPALDGGRLVFLGYELVTRRRANPKIEAMVHMAGVMALGLLMVLVLIKDVGRFF
jgi:regulator of sigma E protease